MEENPLAQAATETRAFDDKFSEDVPKRVPISVPNASGVLFFVRTELVRSNS